MEKEQEQKLIEAFELMWGNYHEPVRLIERGFRVVAANAAYLKNGGQVGVHCNATNPELHRNCRAQAALKEQTTQCHSSVVNGVPWDSYWVPVRGYADYFVHFTNGINEYRAKMAAEQA